MWQNGESLEQPGKGFVNEAETGKGYADLLEFLPALGLFNS